MISPIKGLTNKKVTSGNIKHTFTINVHFSFVISCSPLHCESLFSLAGGELQREGLVVVRSGPAPSLLGLGPFSSLNPCVISRCKLQCWTARMTSFFHVCVCVCVCVCVHICRNAVWTPVAETQTSTGMKAMTRGEEKRGEPDHGPAKQNQILTA